MLTCSHKLNNVQLAARTYSPTRLCVRVCVCAYLWYEMRKMHKHKIQLTDDDEMRIIVPLVSGAWTKLNGRKVKAPELFHMIHAPHAPVRCVRAHMRQNGWGESTGP